MARELENSMQLRLESRSKNESFARQTVAAFAAQLDPTMDELGDIKTAVSEAVTNCIVHAYADEMGYITISAKIFSGGVLQVVVRDRGCGIADVEQAREPLFTTGNEERSGMGFHHYGKLYGQAPGAFGPGRGTTVTMEKRISPRPMRKHS